MSGGSFNYLYCKTPAELFAAGDDLRRMADELDALGHQARHAANRTKALVGLLGHVGQEIQALSDVWQAVEWWRSNDRSREDVYVALGRYQARIPSRVCGRKEAP